MPAQFGQRAVGGSHRLFGINQIAQGRFFAAQHVARQIQHIAMKPGRLAGRAGRGAGGLIVHQRIFDLEDRDKHRGLPDQMCLARLGIALVHNRPATVCRQTGKLHHGTKVIVRRSRAAAADSTQRDCAGQRQPGIKGGLRHANFGHGGIIAPLGDADVGTVAQQIGRNADIRRQRRTGLGGSLYQQRRQIGRQAARHHASQHGDFIKLGDYGRLLPGQLCPDPGDTRLGAGNVQPGRGICGQQGPGQGQRGLAAFQVTPAQRHKALAVAQFDIGIGDIEQHQQPGRIGLGLGHLDLCAGNAKCGAARAVRVEHPAEPELRRADGRGLGLVAAPAALQVGRGGQNGRTGHTLAGGAGRDHPLAGQRKAQIVAQGQRHQPVQNRVLQPPPPGGIGQQDRHPRLGAP